jgi:phosphoribosylglycinamide formyltransferase 1
MTGKVVRAAVLLSGSGRTLENFLDEIKAGNLPLEIVAVVGSRDGIKGLDIAAAAGIPWKVFSRKKFPSIVEHNAALNAWLLDFNPAMIILAGYLNFYMAPDEFIGPVTNIHPALLPRFGGKGFYGDRVHRAVLESGESESGCTVHLVDDQYDTGKILGQERVPVLAEDNVDSLAGRVFAAECRLYPRILAQIAQKLSS